MTVGPFDIDATGGLMFPEHPLSQTGSAQNIAIDNVHNVLFSTQIINDGVQFPDEGAALTQAQRGAAGDLAITKFDLSGNILGLMYVRGAGHGVALSAEPVGEDTYLWMETNASLDGTFAFGTQVGRIKFTAGALYNASDPVMQKFNPIPGFRRVFHSVDFVNNRIAVSYSDLTSQRNRFCRVYDLTQFMAGVFTPIYPEFAAQTTNFQNACIFGNYYYQLYGLAYDAVTNPPPGNTNISVIDVTTGLTLESAFIDTATGLTLREPEGLNVDYSSGFPRLYWSFNTNFPAPVRFVTMFHLLLRPEGGDPEGNWLFTTPTVDEAPFAWNPLMERFRMDRGVSVVEVSPGQYQQVRYDAYTNEIGAVNLPPNPNEQDTDFWPAPRQGLHYFRGGYQHIVSSSVRADIIASGAADASNFILVSAGYGEAGFGELGFGGSV